MFEGLCLNRIKSKNGRKGNLKNILMDSAQNLFFISSFKKKFFSMFVIEQDKTQKLEEKGT